MIKSNIETVNNWLKQRLEPTLKHRNWDRVDIENMVHWLENYPNQSIINTFSVDKVYNSTKKWMLKLQDSGRHVVEQDSDVELIASLSGDMYLVRLVSENAYKYEGSQMNHCVATYAGNNKSKIYSIRDQFNKPHCTIEIEGGHISQIKGKQNRFVVSKYIPAVLEALKHLNVKVESSDMENLGLLKASNSIIKALNKVAGEEIPYVEVLGDKYINNSDNYWFIL